MITAQQAEIIEYLYSCPEHTTQRIGLMANSGPDAYEHVQYLIKLGLIDRPAPHSPYVRLTAKGLCELEVWRSAQEEAAKQQAQKKHQDDLQAALENKRRRQEARRSWVQWTITAILSIAALFAGAVPEMFAGFVQWISSLFH